MIRVEVTKDQRNRAVARYDFFNLKRSVTEGKSQLHGALAEIICVDYFTEKGDRVTDSKNYWCDLEINDFRIDVKARRVNSQPKPHYNAGIFASKLSKLERCDYYLFTRVLSDYSVVWILGFYGFYNFKNNAKFWKKGDTEYGSWKFPEDCYTIPISLLSL